MGLKDALVMSAVSAHDTTKAHPSSAMSATSPSQAKSWAALEDSLLAMTLYSDHNDNHGDDTSNNSLADDMDYQHDLDMDDDEDEDDWEWEADENKLSRALRSWKRDYVITPLPPHVESEEHLPVFSARLGQETAIRRTPSSESVNTQLSLFRLVCQHTAVPLQVSLSTHSCPSSG